MKGPNQNPNTAGMWTPNPPGGQTPSGVPNQSPSGNNAMWAAATAEATPRPPGTHPGQGPGGLLPGSGSGSGPAYLTDGQGMLRPGVVLGKYQIVRPLGAGGMGSVYEAVHTGIGKAVALKTMAASLANDPRAEQRFLREAAAASRLEHPHVVDVTDFGSDNGIIYIVMELMRGEDLAALVQRAPAGLDVTFVADVMLPVCAGVFAAHDKGVIHRDLKPQNIFLARTALGDVVPKVLDFGISKLIDEQANSALTNSGSVMGTTHYLSPEQVTGQQIDGRSDEFALGVILFECVTGRRPHEGETIFTIMRAISEGRFTRPMALRQDLPPPFEAVILKALATRADDRFPTVHALGRALLPFASAKGQVMWAEYFDRGGTLARTHQGPGLGQAGWQATMAVPGMMPGHPGITPGDTRSGVRPVSVMGSNELLQRRRGSGTKKAALLVLGLGAAGALWLSMGKGPDDARTGAPGKDGVSAVARPAEAPVAETTAGSAQRPIKPSQPTAAAEAPSTTPPPPVTPPPPAQVNPTARTGPETGMTEVPVPPARTGTGSAAPPRETAPKPAADIAVAGKRGGLPKTKAGVSSRLREDRFDLGRKTGPLLPKTVQPPIKPAVTTRRSSSPAPQLDDDVPAPTKRPEPAEPPRSRLNPGTSPILD